MSSKLFKNFIKKAILERQPGGPPRPGLQWKPSTHRWIRPSSPHAWEQEAVSQQGAGEPIPSSGPVTPLQIPNYTVELTEGEVSTLLYYLEEVTKDKLDGEFPEEIQTIFSKLEGVVDAPYSDSQGE